MPAVNGRTDHIPLLKERQRQLKAKLSPPFEAKSDKVKEFFARWQSRDFLGSDPVSPKPLCPRCGQPAGAPTQLRLCDPCVLALLREDALARAGLPATVEVLDSVVASDPQKPLAVRIDSPKEWSASLQMVYVAAKLGKATFLVHDLIVQCFVEFPGHFALKGYPNYPCSHKVFGILSGKGGPVAKGYFERVGDNRHKVTDLGRLIAQHRGVQA